MDPVNQRPSICTVPSILRDLSPGSFKPQLVSIGPLHKEETSVQDIESLKKSYHDDLLKRSTSSSNQPKTILEACLQKVNASIVEIKSCYSATNVSEAELANMMVMDGCFILEYCFKDYYKEPTLLMKIQRARIAIDLMLLENQIPFFVLQYIFDLTKPDSISLSLTSLLHKVLLKDIHPLYVSRNTEIPDEFSFPDVFKISNHKHVLDCLHKVYQFVDAPNNHSVVELEKSRVNLKPQDEEENVLELTTLNYNQSAVELERSGVSFRPQKEKNKAMTMEIVKAPSGLLLLLSKPLTLLMPTLHIQDYTEVVLRNFIAYEQLFAEVNSCFTSYSFAMAKLIDNEADVGNLVESRVLIHHLGSHKKVAKLIKSICKNIQVEQFYYSKEMKALDKYYNSNWPKSIALLKRIYFNHPWAMYNVLSGLVLLYLTVIQTIFTIMSYDKPSER